MACNRTSMVLAVSITAVDAVIGVCALLGNGLIMHAVRTFKTLQTPTNLFVVAIATTDVITVLSMPFYVSFYFDVGYSCDATLCKLRYMLSLFPSFWSSLLMIGLALDRYIAVLKPLHYPSLVSKRRVKICIVASAFYMLVLSALPLLPYNQLQIEAEMGEECDVYYIMSVYYAVTMICGHVGITIVITSMLYLKIYWEALRHQKNSPNPFHKRWETNMTVMMMLILGVHLLFLAPYMVVVLVRTVAPDSWQSQLSVAKKVTTMLYFCKCVVNPFICALRNKRFRSAFQIILRVGKPTQPEQRFSFHATNTPKRDLHETLF